jgi:hypothetical protein
VLYAETGRPGLESRDTGAEAAVVESGPIEKAARWVLGRAELASVPWLGALVATPDDAGRDSSTSVVDGDVLGGEIWGVTAEGSLMASTF